MLALPSASAFISPSSWIVEERESRLRCGWIRAPPPETRGQIEQVWRGVGWGLDGGGGAANTTANTFRCDVPLLLLLQRERRRERRGNYSS